MTKKVFNLISLFISLVFAIALVYFVAGTVIDAKRGPGRADSIFSSLEQGTRKAAAAYSVGTYNFSDAFIRSAGDLRNYRKLELSSNGEKIYLYPPAQPASKARHAKSYKSSIQTSFGADLSISAEIYTVRPDSIFHHARTSFIIILIATVIAVLVLIFAKEEPEHTGGTGISLSDGIAEDDERQAEEPGLETAGLETEKEPDPAENNGDGKLNGALETSPVYYTGAGDTGGKDASNEQETAEQKEPASGIEEKNEQERVLPESRLQGTLEEELVKSAEQDNDLTILIIKIDGLARAEKETEKITRVLAEETGTRSQVFEYGDYSYAVLLKSTRLDDALSTAEDLHSKISAALKESGASNSVTVGISSRTGRTISGERLLTEASQAQKHAEEEPDSPIIAFRVNPEKYKEFILNS